MHRFDQLARVGNARDACAGFELIANPHAFSFPH
jgi:hypothetical protein